MLKGKSESNSPLGSKISKSRIGELVTEVGAETISLISDSEVFTFWLSPLLPEWYADRHRRFDSEVTGGMNAAEKLSMKWFSIMAWDNMLDSSLPDPIDGEGKQNQLQGKILRSSLVSNSSVLSSPSALNMKVAGVCWVFSCSGS